MGLSEPNITLTGTAFRATAARAHLQPRRKLLSQRGPGSCCGCLSSGTATPARSGSDLPAEPGARPAPAVPLPCGRAAPERPRLAQPEGAGVCGTARPRCTRPGCFSFLREVRRKRWRVFLVQKLTRVLFRRNFVGLVRALCIDTGLRFMFTERPKESITYFMLGPFLTCFAPSLLEGEQHHKSTFMSDLLWS